MAELTARSALGPRRETITRLLWRLDKRSGVIAMFSVAFLVRLLIAPHLGFFIDLRFFHTWSTELRAVGTHNFYSTDHLADYPPAYMYVLWVIGKLSASPSYLLLKLPALLADLGLAWIAGTFADRLAPASLKERLPVRSLAAAGVLFNPAVIALSAGWGQVDSVPVFIVLSSLLLLFTGAQSLRRELAAFALFGIAFSMKPQTCLVLPVMAYALYRRYLHGRPRPDWIDGGLSIALSAAVAGGIWVISGLPFSLEPAGLVRQYRFAANVAPVTSANAFNFWGVVAFWRHDASGAAVMKLAGVPVVYLGLLAFVAATAYVVWQVHRAIERGLDQARVLLVGAAAESILGYAVLTRMHERYLFLTLGCLAPLVFARRFRLTYVALSALFILNLWYPYAGYNTREHVQALRFEPVFDWLYGGFATDPWQKKMLSLAVTAIAFTFAWRCMRWLEELEPAAPEVARPAPQPQVERLRLPLAAAPLDDASDAVVTRSVARWIPLSR